jgi:hypothetical protein
MQRPKLTRIVPEMPINWQGKIKQLEETIVELYQSFCPVYGTIDFVKVSPEDFPAPYSTHSMRIPNTELNVTLITTPPHLIIGTPHSHTPGPLQWENELKIEFPPHTIFVSIGYGGGPGEVQWFSAYGSANPVPALSAMIAPDQAGHFYLARHEGIVSIQITCSAKMFLNTVSVGIALHR